MDAFEILASLKFNDAILDRPISPIMDDDVLDLNFECSDEEFFPDEVDSESVSEPPPAKKPCLNKEDSSLESRIDLPPVQTELPVKQTSPKVFVKPPASLPVKQTSPKEFVKPPSPPVNLPVKRTFSKVFVEPPEATRSNVFVKPQPTSSQVGTKPPQNFGQTFQNEPTSSRVGSKPPQNFVKTFSNEPTSSQVGTKSTHPQNFVKTFQNEPVSSRVGTKPNPQNFVKTFPNEPVSSRLGTKPPQNSEASPIPNGAASQVSVEARPNSNGENKCVEPPQNFVRRPPNTHYQAPQPSRVARYKGRLVGTHTRIVAALAIENNSYTLTNGVHWVSVDEDPDWYVNLAHDVYRMNVQRLYVVDEHTRYRLSKHVRNVWATILDVPMELDIGRCNFCQRTFCHRWRAVVGGIQRVLEHNMTPIRH